MKKIIYSSLALLFTFSLMGTPVKKKNAENFGVTAEGQVQALENKTSNKAISAVSPYQGEYVFLTNDLMTNWLKTYTYASSAPFATQEKANELYYPKEEITLSWSDKNDCDYYALLFDTHKDFSTAQIYHLTGTEKTFKSLYVATDYYWRVVGFKDGKQNTISDIFHFVTASTPRTIKVDGVSNTRDIGGYMTSFGKRVKQGMVYRSAQAEAITASGKQQATEIYGIKTEIDLRGTFPPNDTADNNKTFEEYLANGSLFNYEEKTVTYKYFWAPWYADSSVNGLKYVNADGEYINDRQLVTIIKEFANIDNYPVLFHCQIGRDRTGTLACVLNALLGVGDEDLHIDYETSFFAKDSTVDKPHVPTYMTIFEGLLGYLYSFEGETLADKTANYLMTYGMTQAEIDTIRNIMLEE